MQVKVRKVGNSYTLSIPKEAAKMLYLEDGQIMEVTVMETALEYRKKDAAPSVIDWKRFQSSGSDIRDGKTPEDYVRSLRDDDRE